ncbi:MAG: RNA 2',3'-cyclic phosphodiesterase [Acidimicrobiaceae bacterium]|nr:RNA 2',3'-cyclic phosphodiesterase [Acidimicrobiaceae bacterium]
MARMFVAVWPPPEVIATLAELREPGEEGLRWTPSTNWHVTLRFLGEVGDDEVPALCHALEGAVTGELPCHAALGPATVRLGRAVLIVPVAGLDPLGAAVTDATGGFGQPSEDRPFVAHLTVARGRAGLPVPRRLAGRLVEGAWDVNEVTLVRSRLGRGGSTYEVVFTAAGS